MARGAVGVLLAYLLMVDGIAYGRNPLRRKRGQGRSTRPQAGPGIIDVSAAAKKSKRTAVWRLAVQFIGLSLAAYGADAVGVHFWYAYLVAGLAIIWAGGWFIRPAGARRDHHRAILAGTHQVPVTGMLTVAATMILLGLAGAVFAGLYLAFPPGSTVLLAPGPGTDARAECWRRSDAQARSSSSRWGRPSSAAPAGWDRSGRAS